MGHTPNQKRLLLPHAVSFCGAKQFGRARVQRPAYPTASAQNAEAGSTKSPEVSPQAHSGPVPQAGRCRIGQRDSPSGFQNGRLPVCIERAETFEGARGQESFWAHSATAFVSLRPGLGSIPLLFQNHAVHSANPYQTTVPKAPDPPIPPALVGRPSEAGEWSHLG